MKTKIIPPVLLPKSSLVGDHTWTDVVNSVLEYIAPKLNKESLISTNSYMDYDDAMDEGRTKALTVLEGLRYKWSDLDKKKINDLVNFVIRCVSNYYVTMRQKCASSVDSSVNTARVVDQIDSDNEELDGVYTTLASCSGGESEIEYDMLQTRALVELLHRGFTVEYVVLRETLFPIHISLPPEKTSLRNIGKYLGLSGPELSEVISNICVTLVRLGLQNKDVIKGISGHLSHWGIIA